MPAAFGTEALIEDFGTDDGLLTLRVRGHRRFRVKRTRVRDSGLVVGEVEWREPDGDDELRPEHALLGTLLQKILEQAGGEHANAGPAQLGDAAWVGWRLAELLPLSLVQRQALLQEDDPHARLQRLTEWVETLA
jgi:Lon protease-like protein